MLPGIFVCLRYVMSISLFSQIYIVLVFDLMFPFSFYCLDRSDEERIFHFLTTTFQVCISFLLGFGFLDLI